MATTMEQRAKFRELRLAGTPREDAMKQAYGDLTAPTPTGGATIPITPTVTQPTTPTTQPIAKAGDVVIGVGGEKFVQANNYDGSTNVQGQGQVVNQSGQALNQMQQIQAESFGRREGANISPLAPREAPINNTVSGGVTPTTPTTTPPTAPTPSTPSTKPSDFRDLMKGKDEYGPDGRKVIGYRSSYGGPGSEISSADRIPVYEGDQYTPPLNADQMFSSIVMKAPVPDDQKTTTQYKIAQNRYLKANSYASMTPAQVSSDITSGKLIEGSQTYEDIKALNPKLIQDTNNLRIVNGSKVSLYSTDTQGNKINNVEQSFAEDYLGNFGTFLKSLFTVQTPEQIRSAIYTDDVKQAQDKATSIELELNQIEADQAKMEEITRKELEGTGASAERIRLEVGIRQEKLQNQYNSKLKEYNTYANKANNLITQNTTVYQEQMKQQSAQQQALAGAAGQVFSQGLSQENAIFQANLGLQTNKAEFEQKVAQQAIQMGTPELAIPEVINQYAQLGIMASKSAQQHIADAKAFIARGGTLGQYISQMQKDFQAKPEYKAKFAPKATENFELKEVGGKTYRFNQATGEYEVISPITAGTGGDLRYLAGQFPGQAWAKNNNPAGITWNANFDKGTGTAKLFADAGIQFSKGTARPANEGGNYVSFNTIEDGLKAQQILMTQTYGNSTVGNMLASWVGTTEGPNYAKQVAGMAGITDLNAKVSSLSPEQVSALQMAKIKKESPGLYGILSQGTGAEGEVMGSFGIPFDYQNRIEQMIPVQLRNTEAEQEKLKQNVVNLYKSGISVEDAALRYMGFSPKSGTDTKKANELISQARGLGEKLPENYFTNLSDYVNRGDMKGAEDYTNRVVESVLKGELGADFISTPNLQFSKNTLDRINGFIEKNKDKIGPLSGRIADLEKTFMNDPDYQALKTLLGGSLADVRRTFGGTAVTATELGALRDFIGLDTKMPIQNLITALQTNYDTLENQYNTQRGFYGATQTQAATKPTQNPIVDLAALKERVKAKFKKP